MAFPKAAYRGRAAGNLTLTQLRDLDALLTQFWLDDAAIKLPEQSDSQQANRSAAVGAIVRTVRDLHRERQAAMSKRKSANKLSDAQVFALRHRADMPTSTYPLHFRATAATLLALQSKGLLDSGYSITDAGYRALSGVVLDPMDAQ